MTDMQLLDEAIDGFNASFGEHIRIERWGRGYVAWFPWDEYPERLACVPHYPELAAFDRAAKEPVGSPQRTLALALALKQWGFDDLIHDAKVIAAGRGQFLSKLGDVIPSKGGIRTATMVRMPSGVWVSDYGMGESRHWEELADA